MTRDHCLFAPVGMSPNKPVSNNRGQHPIQAVTFRHGPFFFANRAGHGIMSGSGSKVGPAGVLLIRQRVQRGFVTWLAGFALALILFAPSISRTLAHAAPGQMPGMDCPGSGVHAHHPDAPGHPDTPNADEACGYCTLMCHSPVLTSGIVLTVPALPAASWSAPGSRQDSPQPALLERRSRGPPAV
ncbi:MULTISPECIES: DUF2946 domain-containing protein [unclassified Rhodanobacter]|uniref:DUF2946 domain-containing protein n=1 Tax=unclassified Rhodanobacter TaxID=2621553 RepID=UPI001115A92E|nr:MULTISPECIES: DUF2946 domain-containing protein [unclassified Rhodanobacter]